MTESTLEELAAEELSASELRTLLERIGEGELGGSDAPTIGALAEATGRSPAELGQMLGVLRGDAFRDRFAGVIQDHEGRLAAIEKKLPGTKPSNVKDFSYDSHNFRLRKGGEPAKPIDVILAIAIAVVALVAAWLLYRG